MEQINDKAKLLGELQISGEERDLGESEAAAGRTRWIIGAIAGALIALAAGFLMWNGQAVAVEIAVTAPPSASVGNAPILQATGYVTARREATASAQITGTLAAVLIEEGEHVAAGQVLARLDDTSQRASLAQAQAQLRAAEALEGEYEAQLDQARSDARRDEKLLGEAVSQQTLETARTQVRVYTAQVESQRRQVELARAQVAGATVQLDYCTIRAPFTGVITAKAAQPGEIVSPMSAGGGFTRTGIGTIVDMDSLEIDVDVNEAYINRVKPGQPAEAVLDAYLDWNIPAHVIAVVPTADRSKGTVKVRIGIDQKDPRILPDMGVRVSFLEKAARTATHLPPIGVLVPGTAVVDRGGKNVVFTVEGERVHARVVTAGERFGDLRLVEGIQSGVKVVRTPGPGLTDGARISITRKS